MSDLVFIAEDRAPAAAPAGLDAIIDITAKLDELKARVQNRKLPADAVFILTAEELTLFALDVGHMIFRRCRDGSA